MKKRAKGAFPIHDLIAERWSPLAFDARVVDSKTLGSLFEAARWAPSCFNEQPWRFLVATRESPEEFERLAACLVEGNAWAKRAPVLALSVAKLDFERNGKRNRHAYHDVGLAVGNLVLQAQSLGLAVHQMGGFDLEKARADLSIPEGCDPVAMIALGYPGDTSTLPPELQARERSDRARMVQESFVFGARWESAPGHLGK